MSAATPILWEAYRAAHYAVRMPGGARIMLRPDVAPHASLCSWLGVDKSWAMLTAWNPRSEPCPAADNRAATRVLRVALTRRFPAARWLPAQSTAPDGQWREVQLLVAGAARHALAILAWRFGQIAILDGRCGGRVRLRRLDTGLGARLARMDSDAAAWAESAVA